MALPTEENPVCSPETFSWGEGSWRAAGAGDGDARIVIAGDWAPIRAFAPLISEAPEAVYGDLLPLFRDADLALVNLEAPLSDRGSEVWKSGAVFKGSEHHVSGLTAVPFHAVTLANNHVFDFGRDAFDDTINVLERNAIRHVGAGDCLASASKPMVLEAGDVRVAVVNFSEGEDLTEAGDGPGVFGWDIPRVERLLAKAKEEADIVIAISHAGIEYIPFPPPYVTEAFKAVASAGADIVIGHHPHVPQGIGFHDGVPICYSLGNFVFYQDTPLSWRKIGYVVSISVSGSGITSLSIVPYQIHDKGLSRLKAIRREAFFRKFRDLSRPLESDQGIQDAWHGFLHHYGKQGFEEEVERLLSVLKTQPEKGAAMFRNRLTTLQHYHHWKDTMTRIIEGNLESSSDGARTLVREWLTRIRPIEEEGAS